MFYQRLTKQSIRHVLHVEPRISLFSWIYQKIVVFSTLWTRASIERKFYREFSSTRRYFETLRIPLGNDKTSVLSRDNTFGVEILVRGAWVLWISILATDFHKSLRGSGDLFRRRSTIYILLRTRRPAPMDTKFMNIQVLHILVSFYVRHTLDTIAYTGTNQSLRSQNTLFTRFCISSTYIST